MLFRRYYRGVFALAFAIGFASAARAQFATGLEFVDEVSYRSIPLATTPLLGDLPEEVDLKSDFPAPGHQGAQGSCVGWALAYALKSYQERVERNWNFESKKQHFSPSFIYNQIRKSKSCKAGTFFTDGFNLLRRDGVATMEDFPYDENDCEKLPSAAIKQRAREYAIADWRRVNPQDETEVKLQIASGFPVIIGAMVDKDFMELRSSTPYAGTGTPSEGGHAMVTIGYSDELKAFKIINSWGQSWGDKGFGWITYDAFRKIVREAYVAQDIVMHKIETVEQRPGQGPREEPNVPELTQMPPQVLRWHRSRFFQTSKCQLLSVHRHLQ